MTFKNCAGQFKVVLSQEEFEALKWLHMTARFSHCINSITFNYLNDQCPNYLNKVFETVPEKNIQT